MKRIKRQLCAYPLADVPPARALLHRAFERGLVLGAVGQWFRHLASRRAAPARLLRNTAALVEDTAVEQLLDEIGFFHDGIIAPNLALHCFGRATAVERDHRVPTRLV